MWVSVTLAATFFWATVNIIDKVILTKWIKRPLICIVVLGFLNLLAGLGSFFIFGFEKLSGLQIFLSFLAGFFYVLMCVFYFLALAKQDVTKTTPLFHLSTLFVALFAAIFLGEIFTLIKYVGIVLLFLGATGLSLEENLKFKIKKSFWLMILACLAIALNSVITKHLLNTAEFWTIFGWTRVFTFVSSLPLICFYYPKLKVVIKTLGLKVVYFISLAEGLNIVAILLFTLAMSLGPVTLVNSLTSAQPFILLILTIFLSLFFPKILKEKITPRIILIKIIAFICLSIGAIMIF